MAIAAAFFTVSALPTVESDRPSDVRNAWLVMGISTLLFFGGLTWLVLNYRHAQRPWWKLINYGNSCGGGATGLAIFLSGTETLLPIAYGMWAWTITLAVIVSLDSRYEGHTWTREGDVPEYAIGTPHDPRMHSQQS